MKITSIRMVKPDIVYDITVRDAHHYVLENGVITHNSGAEYAGDQIVMLSKSKDSEKDGKGKVLGVNGVVVKATLFKSRLTIENKFVETYLSYTTGLDRYYGLVDIAIKAGIFKKISTRIEYAPGKTEFEKTIENNPESTLRLKYFNKSMLLVRMNFFTVERIIKQ